MVIMGLDSIVERVRNRGRRELAEHWARRPFTLPATEPMISFTFDDFPISALTVGGGILSEVGVSGTYYTSFGLVGTQAPTGRIFQESDLALLQSQRQELGCHTYAHLHAWDTSAADFEKSILENRERLKTLLPELQFTSLSYPISCPNPGVKRVCEKYFDACRGGGQTWNVGTVDLNHLKSFFLEQAGLDLRAVESMIEECVAARGWLIFSTHDVDPSPTRYGVPPNFFKSVVESAIRSGAAVVPVGIALERLAVSRVRGLCSA